MVVAGYEANGGFLLGMDVQVGSHTLKALPTHDAVLPMLAFLVAATKRGVALSRLPASLPAGHTASDRIQQVATDVSRALIASLRDDPTGAGAWLAPDAGGVVHQD
jgi:phosphomannomutase